MTRQQSVLSESDAVRELADERARLDKLWTAYRAQEAELRALGSSGLLERQVGDQAQRIATLEREGQALRRELDQVKSDYERAQDTLRSYERENEELRVDAAFRKKAEKLEVQLAEERERLAKLFKVNQDTEAEKREADILLLAWQDWYKTLKPALRRGAEAVARAPGQEE